MTSLGAHIRNEIGAQGFPLHDSLQTIQGSGALSLIDSISVVDALMTDPKVRFSRTPLSVPPDYASITSARMLVELLNSGFNRGEDTGLPVHPNNPAILFCSDAEYRFAETYAAMQQHNASSTWESQRGVRLVIGHEDQPLFVQKAPTHQDELALALTVGDVTIAGHTFPPGFLARIKVTNEHPKIARPGVAEKISVDDVVSARILRTSAFVLSIEERQHWPLGDIVTPRKLLDPTVSVAAFVDVARQTASILD